MAQFNLIHSTDSNCYQTLTIRPSEVQAPSTCRSHQFLSITFFHFVSAVKAIVQIDTWSAHEGLHTDLSSPIHEHAGFLDRTMQLGLAFVTLFHWITLKKNFWKSKRPWRSHLETENRAGFESWGVFNTEHEITGTFDVTPNPGWSAR